MSARVFPLVAVGSICLLLAAGCTSGETRGGGPGPRAPELVVAMRGDVNFFSNALRAEATVSQVRAGRGRGGAGEGGGTMGGRGGHGGRRRDRGEASFDSDASANDAPRAALPRMVGPALTLRVKFTNLSAQPLDVQIRDVQSELGSFAVRPERLLLAPGQTSELDPMVSQLGVVSAAIPVTIVLQAGPKTETQVVPVKAIAPEPAPKSP